MVDDLDFSLFQSHEDILYDALGDLFFDEDDIAIDISDCIELEECCVAQLLRKVASASMQMVNRAAHYSLLTTIMGCGTSVGS